MTLLTWRRQRGPSSVRSERSGLYCTENTHTAYGLFQFVKLTVQANSASDGAAT